MSCGYAHLMAKMHKKISLEELEAESLKTCLDLLSQRCSLPSLAALLSQKLVSELLQSDLSPFYRKPDDACFGFRTEGDQEGGKEDDKEGGKDRLLWYHRVESFLQELIPSGYTRFPCSASRYWDRYMIMDHRDVELPEFNNLFRLKDGVERAYYAVFDGHGDEDAATFASTHLHVALSKQENLQSDPEAAFKQAFTQTNEMFCKKAARESLKSISTGVSVLIHGQRLTVAWLGDSQAILVRKGQVEELVVPHKPDREDEKQRIEGLGGSITFTSDCWRVNETYAVSRAIGGFDQKPYVSGDADCSSIELQGDEDYVLLACNDFFDTVKPSSVPGMVVEALRELSDPNTGYYVVSSKSDLEVAHWLVTKAHKTQMAQMGGHDNFTVIVVFLNSPQRIVEENPPLSEDVISQDTLQQEDVLQG